MPYLYEMHYHTPQTSFCSKVPPTRSFPYYIKEEYKGIVITDHYYREWFDDLSGLKWNQKIDKWLTGYKAAKKAAKNTNMNIILGMELRFIHNFSDFLVYGITEHLLYEYPKLYNMPHRDFKAFADKHGLFFAQAHPFRNGCTALSPDLLHGVETYNGNPRLDSHNDLAEKFAEKNDLIALSGSDFHHLEDACRGGMLLNECPDDSKALAALLFENSALLRKTINS